MTLKALFQTSCKDYLEFKGGTSLSKGWHLIDRFSEDIDVALNHRFFVPQLDNNTQLKNLRKKSRKFIVATLAGDLDAQLKAHGLSGYEVKPEIVDEVGKDNAFIFGLKADEIVKMKQEHSYNPTKYLDRNPSLAKVVNQLGKKRLEKIYDLADVYHCDNIERVADDFIEEAGITAGNFDNVGDCRYAIPSHWDIGKVYKRLIKMIAEKENIETVDALINANEA